MKRWWLLGIFGLLVALHGSAQQVIYANLKELVEDRGDTLSTLKIEKRSKNQILLMGGADYRVSVDDNPGLCRYLKSRCYAVRADSALYVNCKKVRYKRFRFGGWYAPAIWIQGENLFLRTACRFCGGKYHTTCRRYKAGGEMSVRPLLLRGWSMRGFIMN